jgi:hypothetical protein
VPDGFKEIDGIIDNIIETIKENFEREQFMASVREAMKYN